MSLVYVVTWAYKRGGPVTRVSFALLFLLRYKSHSLLCKLLSCPFDEEKGRTHLRLSLLHRETNSTVHILPYVLLFWEPGFQLRKERFRYEIGDKHNKRK